MHKPDQPKKQGGCCIPPRPESESSEPKTSSSPRSAVPKIAADAVLIPGGRSLMGTRLPGIPDDGEDPIRKTQIKPFWIGATTVTNDQFAEFVAATGYVTEAERFGWSFVFWAQVPKTITTTQGVSELEWWRRVEGAHWRDIHGPGTEPETWHADHPVVHISWNDARAYARWAGGRLPTEAEWEHAARGGLGDVKFPWGDQEPNDDDFQPCNIWQGSFPRVNSAKDGFATTAPARHYNPNGYGLYNMAGNVWEWTAEPFRIKSLKKHVRQRLAETPGYKLSKGGSFLCHRSYCYRYRIAARSGSSPDSATTHHGFRMVWSA